MYGWMDFVPKGFLEVCYKAWTGVKPSIVGMVVDINTQLGVGRAPESW